MQNPDCTETGPHERHELIHDGWCDGLLPGEDDFNVAEWWRRTNADDHLAFIPKFEEYGSEDLLAIGRTMADILGKKDLTDQQATELGIFFYLYGKMARWVEAVKEGRPVSDDTLHDLTVYSMMARLNRAGGMN